MVDSVSNLSAAKEATSMARAWPVAILTVLSIIWGMAFVAVKYSVTFLSPVNLTLLRWFMASGALLILAPFFGKGKGKFQLKDLPRLALVSFASVVTYHLALNFSESSISAGLAVLITSLGPVFILLLSRLFLAERHGRNILLAMPVAFAGITILSVGSDINSGGSSLYGIIEAIGAALSYSVFAVFSKPLVMKYGAIPVTIWVGLLGTLMLIPLVSGSFVSQVSVLPADGWISVLYLSLASTVLGYMIFYTLVNRGAVSRLAVQLYLIPLVGVIGGVVLLGESISMFTIAGGAAVLLAVAIATGNLSNKMRGRKAVQL